MEKVYFTAKKHISEFKLDFCCWFAPVRVGLLFVGYVNIIIDLVCIMGIANDGLSPTVMKVQEILLADFISKPVPVIAYTAEFAFNVVLLCAVYRRDVVLLRVFLYYTLMAIVMSIMTYSIVLAAVPFHIQLAIVSSVLFQMYCILLIRSVMVEVKMEKKTYELPRLVMSSLLKDKVRPCIYDPNNGKIQEVTIDEVPKKQDVQITIIGKDDKVSVKPIEFQKVTEVKLDTDAKKPVELKKDAEVKVQIETKETKDDKKKAEKKIEEERKKDEKKIKEEKKKEEKAMKEEKKKEEKKLKEEKKKGEKKTKVEKKKEEEMTEEETKTEEKKDKEEKTKDEKIITSLILKKYKDDKEAEKEAKQFKEIPLQTVSEHPKE